MFCHERLKMYAHQENIWIVLLKRRRDFMRIAHSVDYLKVRHLLQRFPEEIARDWIRVCDNHRNLNSETERTPHGSTLT